MNWTIVVAGLLLGIGGAAITSAIVLAIASLASVSVFEDTAFAFYCSVVVTIGALGAGGWINTKLENRAALMDRVLAGTRGPNQV